MWTSACDMNLKLYHSLVGHPHKFWSTIIPLYLVGRINCRSKFCGWVGVTISSLEALSGYRKYLVQALYPLLLGVFTKVTVIDSLVFLLY